MKIMIIKYIKSCKCLELSMWLGFNKRNCYNVEIGGRKITHV